MIPELKKPYFLAGGIHLGNIRQAASHGPYCIDVSSAVETGGRKDRRKMEEIARSCGKKSFKKEKQKCQEEDLESMAVSSYRKH